MLEPRECLVCHKTFTPKRAREAHHNQACSRKCGLALSLARRRAKNSTDAKIKLDALTSLERKTAKQRLEGLLWRNLRSAIDTLSEMPSVDDVVEVAKKYDGKRNAIPIANRLVIATIWLMEFESTWKRQGGQP